ncbi:MAG: ATP phosphoribosyltransferase [Bacteroidota bacterium]|nr:MAG: ATP phosphoribosyltransferase [Bacteroidota bacterium]
MKKENIRIAIQKSGRLNEDSLKLLKDCGISINNGKDQLKTTASNFPMEIYYLRNGDIPQYLRDGVVDLAIIGENLLIEKGEDISILENLGFSKCRVSMAVPKEAAYNGIEDLAGKRIATSYPKTVQKYLSKWGIEADLHIINGSVEIAPNIGLSDAICDIVSSGSTLFKNNLKEVEVMFKSEAVLVSGNDLSDVKKELLETLLFRIRAVLAGKNSRYVIMNVPNDAIAQISNILPVLKSPTVMPLVEEGWSSLHSVVNKNTFWEMVDELKAAGARDILVCPIERMIQ